MNANQYFNENLEQYVFNVTAKIIGTVTEKDQTKLIDLLNTINKYLPVDTIPVEYPLEIYNENIDEFKKNDVESPLEKASIDIKKWKEILYRSIEINQKEIEDTALCITRVESLIDKAKQTINDGYSKTKMVDHYQYLKTNYTTRLAQLEAFRQRKLSNIDE